MELTKKHLLMLIIVLVVATILCLTVFQMLCQDGKEESLPLVIYADEGLKCRVASFQEPGVFHNFGVGWNNETFWFNNVGDQRIEIGMFVTALPEGWDITWDYDRAPIEPSSAVKVVISVFSAYLMPADSLMLGVDFKYRVLDQE